MRAGQDRRPHMSQLTFAPIPNEILRRTDLSHGAKLCCARLIQYAGKDGQAFPKLATLGEELGMSPRAVQRFLTELESHKLLTTQQRGRGQSNILLFALSPIKIIIRYIKLF